MYEQVVSRKNNTTYSGLLANLWISLLSSPFLVNDYDVVSVRKSPT